VCKTDRFRLTHNQADEKKPHYFLVQRAVKKWLTGVYATREDVRISDMGALSRG